MKHRSIFLFAISLAHCGQAVRPTTTDSSMSADAVVADVSSECIAGWKVIERAVPVATPGNALVRAVLARRASESDAFTRQVLWVDGPQPVAGRRQQILLSRYDGAGRLDRDDRALFGPSARADEGSVAVITADQDRGIASASIAEPACYTAEWSAGLSLSAPRTLSMPPCFALWGQRDARFLLSAIRSTFTTLTVNTFAQGFESMPTVDLRVNLPDNEHITNGWASASRQSILYFAYRTPTNAVRAVAFDSPRTSALLELSASRVTALAAAADDNAGWFVVAPAAGPLELVRIDARDFSVRRATILSTPNAGLLVSAAVSAVELLVTYFEGSGSLRVAVVDLRSMQLRGVIPVADSAFAFGPKIAAVGEREAFIVHNAANGRIAATTLARCQGN